MKIQAFPQNLGLLVSACALLAFTPACTDDGEAEETSGDGDTVGETEDDTTGDGTETTGTEAGTTDTDGETETTAGDTTGGDDTTTTGGEETTTTGEEETTGGANGCTAPDPGWGSPAAVGSPAPHFGGTNQYGDDVNICEYEGLPILIDTSAVWCGPCQMMSMCLGGNDNLCVELFGGNQGVLDVLITPMRAEIEADTFAWVTVITENAGGMPPTNADAMAWDNNYPGPEKVWVVADEEQNYYGHVPLEAFPSFWLIGEDMNWQDLDQQNVFNTVIQNHL